MIYFSPYSVKKPQDFRDDNDYRLDSSFSKYDDKWCYKCGDDVRKQSSQLPLNPVGETMNYQELTAFLQKNHFIPNAEYSMPDKGMSSWIDAFSSDDVLLRIVVDRGQRFIDLARFGTDTWVDVFTLASKVDPTLQFKKGSFAEAIRVLTGCWPTIIRGLDTSN